MKRMIAGAVLFVCVAAAQGFAQAVSDAEVEQACVTLQKTLSDVRAAHVMQGVAGNKAYPDRWRSRALGVYALTALIQLNTNQFGHVMAIIEREYPGQTFLTVTLEDCMRPCVRCKGDGRQEVSCPTCRGAKAAVKTCARCAGAGKIAIDCLECKGVKSSFALNERVAANCQSLLAELLAEVRQSAVTAQSLHQLEGAWFINVPAALRLLDAYLAAHPHVAARGDFDVLREKLVMRKWVHLAAIILVGVVVFFVLVNILKATVFRPKPDRLRRPPGLDAIDYSKFSDPLTPDKPRDGR